MGWPVIKKIVVVLLSFIADRISSEQILTSPKVTDWGRWGMWENCPSGSYATGMQLRTHPPQGIFGDDKSLTGIRLFCNPYGGTKESHKIQSSFDSSGSWGHKFFCSGGGVMTGFQLRSEPYRSSFVDDTAANNLRMFCSNEGHGHIQGDGNGFGKWSEKRACGKTEVVCGISTQIDTSNGWDKTGLNNVMMKCCDIPHPLHNCVPNTSWELIHSCSNNPSTTSTSDPHPTKTCKYSRKVGVSYSNDKSKIMELYNRAGYQVSELASKLRSNFLRQSGMKAISNAAAEYDSRMQEDSKELYWSLSPEYVWEPQVSIPANLTAEKGHQVGMYQLRGSCGMLQVWGTRFKIVELAKMDMHQTKSTTYIDFNNNNKNNKGFNGDDYNYN